MTFDQSTRNRLARFVGEARSLLTEEFTRQLQHEYGLDPVSGEITPIEKLIALDDARRETARILRETMDYYLAGKQENAGSRRDILDRILREQAFTVLNRLCALRMAEGRGLLIESVGRGYQSKGFQLYARLAGPALGETGETYRSYLFSLFDEFAVDLPVLFDRFSPQGRLFPRGAALLKLLELINDPEIDPLWAEDETIGWVYQYFNSKEERQKMRAESSVPRNSRELAVRNQFFTPRYVVEFLTDNTLGRIWYEMTKGETSLKDSCRYLVRRPNEFFLDEGQEAPEQAQPDEELSQEELLKRLVYIPYRPLKDPREIKMLDPACGSMHFGLYAFDLFEQIYNEAWDLEEKLGIKTPGRLADHDSLHVTYLDKNAFLRDVPRLIIERNIHGIDIDPRAVQIAGLSLWLRAQKSWQAQGLKPGGRPSITKSNIVCAESMPGDRSMLEEFLSTLREDHLEGLIRNALHMPINQKLRVTKAMADALSKLVRLIWKEMELAGKLGSLLKVEETLRDAIAQAQKASEEKAPLFRVLEYGMEYQTIEHKNQEILSGDYDFWVYADALVLSALQEFVVQVENGGGFRRWLFAEDTIQGLALGKILRNRYDILLMNPPFGEMLKETKQYATNNFIAGDQDILACFVERGCELRAKNGLLGAITSRTVFFNSTTTDWRVRVVRPTKVNIWIELGADVLDSAMVETVMFVLGSSPGNRSLFIGPKSNSFLSTLPNVSWVSKSEVHSINIENFTLVQGMPFSYWLDQRLFSCIKILPTIEDEGLNVRVGLQTGDDFRFIRAWWEVPNDRLRSITAPDAQWVAHAKGGDNSPFYVDIHLVVNWTNNGDEISNHPSSVTRSSQYYLKSGLTFSYRTFRFSPAIMPPFCITGVAGMGIFAECHDLFFAATFLNSTIVNEFISVRLGHLEMEALYQAGTISPTPFPKFSSSVLNSLSAIGKRQLVRLRRITQSDETSRYFCPIQGFKEADLVRLTQQLITQSNEILSLAMQDFIEADRIISDSYGIKPLQIMQLLNHGEKIFARSISKQIPTVFEVTQKTISFALGCVYGRWNIISTPRDEYTNDSIYPATPLPKCSPRMLQNNQGLPATTQDIHSNYPLRISWGGILSDDEGQPEDVEDRIRKALQVIWGKRSEAIETEACQILGVGSLGEYFRKPSLFFTDHLKRYSKSRRQAPIYWPLSTPSNSYTLWLYYHRLSDQILFTCVNDFVDPKLKQVSEEAARLRLKKGRSASDEKELERLTDFERELKDLRAELLRVAAFWKPNLNDGVQITAAPLWKLFQHRPWQKKLKETWEKLERGDYDWAHLAYSIWPERVREKCKTDKSLSIAHDLEHLYEEPKALLKKKKGKKQADMGLEELINED